VWATPHLPEVDDVTDQIDDVALAVLEEVEQPVGLSGAGTQMHVGYEDCAHVGVQTGFCSVVFPNCSHALV
jgi:hypothetical protein